jgi:hypothetical protein
MMSSGTTTCFPHLMTKKMWMTYEREQTTEEREEKKKDKLYSPFFFVLFVVNATVDKSFVASSLLFSSSLRLI